MRAAHIGIAEKLSSLEAQELSINEHPSALAADVPQPANRFLCCAGILCHRHRRRAHRRRSIWISERHLGLVLKILTFPFTILTFGLFWFVINAVILEITSTLVPGFFIRSFFAALIGAILLTLVDMGLKALVRDERR